MALALFAFGIAEAASLRPVGLQCELAVEPTGVDILQPRLSWQLQSDQRAVQQTAWQIQVASSAEFLARGNADLWDSGKVNGSESLYHPYAGSELQPSQEVFWQVRVWDNNGEVSEWSHPSRFTMGLWEPEQWNASWIAAAEETESVLLRREFSLQNGLRRAVVHVSGLGHYVLTLNGERVGKDLLTPGWTNYDVTALYNSFDVTDHLQAGANAIGMMLGNGMYHVVRDGRFAKFVGSFGHKRAVLHLRLEYEDGRVEIIGTDGDWKSHAGPVTFSNMYGGEDHDARLEPRGWKLAGFAGGDWRPVRVVDDVSLETLRGHHAGSYPVRVIEERKPAQVRQLDGPGATLYDFGQNTSYMPRLTVRGPRGSKVRLIPGERIYPDGIVSRSSMGGIHRNSSWWEYTKATDGEEVWEAEFFYIGSRYIQAQAMAADAGGQLPEIVDLTARLVHATAKPVGQFKTSDPLLNRIRELVRWAQRSNMVSVLTDCPHREKLGWLEQIHLNGPSLRYEFDLARIFSKAMYDMRDAQTDEGLVPNIAPEFTEFRGTFRAAAEWGAAFFQVAWQQYLINGDSGLIETFYPAMREYFDYLQSKAESDILSEGLGDWFDLGPRRPPGRAQLTLSPVTATAYLFYNAKTMAQMAEVLGKTDDAEYFNRRAEQIRSAFNNEFFVSEELHYVGNTQTANSMPLVMGIVDPANKAAVLDSLLQDLEERDTSLTAGGVGYRYLLRALAEGGRSDVIQRMIVQEDMPGYAWQLKAGATALTESWEAHATTSNNHFMLGHITEWFYHDLAGIRPDPTHPGFARVNIAPQPVSGVDWVDASYNSVRGPIRSHWQRKGDRFELEVEIPANVLAEVWLPALEGTSITESGRSLESVSEVEVVGRASDCVRIRIGSGTYKFVSKW